jgi:hypothetical protein
MDHKPLTLGGIGSRQQRGFSPKRHVLKEDVVKESFPLGARREDAEPDRFFRTPMLNKRAKEIFCNTGPLRLVVCTVNLVKYSYSVMASKLMPPTTPAGRLQYLSTGANNTL